jgi:hypothetical protein
MAQNCVCKAGVCMIRNANEDPLTINEHFCKVAALNHKIVLDWKIRFQEQR